MSRALTVSQSTGQEHLSAAMLVVAAMTNLTTGRLSAAREQAETAIDSSLLSANNLFRTWAFTVRCMVEIECGSPSAAVRFGQKALQAGIQSRSPWSSVATWALPIRTIDHSGGRRARNSISSRSTQSWIVP